MHKPWRAAPHPRRSIRDFHRAHYGNPLFNRQKTTHRTERRGPSRAPWFLACIAVAALAGGTWYLLWGATFHITTVEVRGVTGPSADAIRAGIDSHRNGATLFIFPRSNILIFNTTKALADIGSKVYLDSITLRKKLPDTLEVIAHEKTTRAALDWNNRLFALDENGFVLRELTDKEIALMGDLPPGMAAVPVLGLGAQSIDLPKTDVPSAATDGTKGTVATPPPQQPINPFPLILIDGGEKEGSATGKNMTPGKTMVSPATMRTILQAHARLPDVAGSAVRWFRVQESSETVEADMVGDWHILLATASPFNIQVERLSIVLKEKIGAKKPMLEYVDLRYNERIFFRLKDGTTPK